MKFWGKMKYKYDSKTIIFYESIRRNETGEN